MIIVSGKAFKSKNTLAERLNLTLLIISSNFNIVKISKFLFFEGGGFAGVS
jgi:hypothetical protein